MSLLHISSKEDRGDDIAIDRPTQYHSSFERDETSSTIIRSQSQHSRRHSSGVPGLTHRLSHKLSSTFGHPTVVHRTSLRSRPSVRSIREALEPLRLDDPTSPQDVSAASTYNSGSGSSPVHVSTNPTSDGLSASPIRSTARNLPFTDCSRMLTFSRDPSLSRLSPIRETPNIVVPSIVTVEATATAKIYFETHFMQTLLSHRPRSQRRRDLETVLEKRNWSQAKRIKARAAFIRQENEFLRQDRVLKTKANALKRSKGVSIAGYEIVKVLGKGSFGVVRLVKEKNASQPEMQIGTTPEPIKRWSTSDLAMLKSTARGAFPLLGARRKEVAKAKKEVYAMKVIRKSDMLRNSQEGHLRAERDFLVASENSRWVVPLIAAFQDNKNLYLVMHYCVGGDFLGLLIRKNTLSEEVTRWYIAEMILCVEEAHSLRWIHRDVKPDNFLIGADGHLKISDFGLAFDAHWAHDQAFFHNHRHSLVEKLGVELHGDEQDKTDAETAKVSQNIGKVMARPGEAEKEKRAKEVAEPADDEAVVDWRDKNQRRKLARSVVGTSQYMAPEVIRGDPYDGRCDWWSIGIILYECLFGFTPFACENRQETKLKILKHRTTLCFPDDQYGFPSIGSEVLDLMKRLLREKEERLSSPKYYLNDYAYSQTEDNDTYHIHGPADKSSKNYQGKHVYSDDADDIKAHPWFKSIDWMQMEKKKPPFVPKVKGWEDTKYFDDDESVSDLVSSSSEEDAEAIPPAKENLLGLGNVKQDPQVCEDAIVAAANIDSNVHAGHHHEDQHIIPSYATKYNDVLPKQNAKPLAGNPRTRLLKSIPIDSAAQNNSTITTLQPQFDGGPAGQELPVNAVPNPNSKKPKREKKRPRDKILRDPVTAKLALEIRRRGAFLGYAYRRPKGVQSVLERVEGDAEAEREKDRLNRRPVPGCAHCGEVHVGSHRSGRRRDAIVAPPPPLSPPPYADTRRDSAIAGIAGLGLGIGGMEEWSGRGARDRELEESLAMTPSRPMGRPSTRPAGATAAGAGAGRGGKTPSPRCITPVENLAKGLSRMDNPRFGLI
jgi:serine/threonine protein kinase